MTTPTRRRRSNLTAAREDDDDSDNEEEDGAKATPASLTKSKNYSDIVLTDDQAAKMQKLVTAAEYEKENADSKPEPRNLAAEQEAFYAATDETVEAPPPKPKQKRSNYLDAASALCQLVHKDDEGRTVEDRIDTSATIGLAPTPMKSMAEAAQV